MSRLNRDEVKGSSLWLSHPVNSGIVPDELSLSEHQPYTIRYTVTRYRDSSVFCGLDFPPRLNRGGYPASVDIGIIPNFYF
ncbi:hypothetical protein A3D03_01360 [Candidatus Gottesmanbacteria bacterium RIFCSPHIGHO2_02_FULL_40_13]|uniref:Uncharacterized protein n=1 Tax=Candidatus Gottesmanbacteria bacterium RIFCSPHIGHO2_02_FULL_40_13 TaxID=1798384 RepID=A0A1F6AB13_9BACT|nr:MAG: hypothetical protein A3D03_01360 [Candidatus Gottesmanbacteria bacterium RIFCSPHIGHO2_02_FULL_40_13]